MYCMECGKEIPEDGQFCPGCGVSAPRKASPPPAPYSYPYPAPYPYPYQYPGLPQAPPAGQVYPGPDYPAYYGYPPYQAAPPVVVVPMGNPLPRKPPLSQRIRERQEVYLQQARENRLETGLGIAAAGMVVLGVLAMLVTSL